MTVIEDSWSYSRPTVRVDASDHTGIVFQRTGNDPGIMFSTDATGGWSSSRISSGSYWTPGLAFDGSGHAHVLFARRDGTPGVYEVSNATGSWSEPSLVAADPDPWSTAVAADGASHLHAAYTSNFSITGGSVPWGS